MKIIFKIISLVLLFSCTNNKNNLIDQAQIVNPFDSFIISFPNDYEVFNLNFTNSNLDTIITFASTNQTKLNIYTKDQNDKYYHIIKEIDIPQINNYDFESGNLNKLNNNTYLITSHSSKEMLLLDSNFNIIDTIVINYNSKYKNKNIFPISHNTERIVLMNDSVLFFRIGIKPFNEYNNIVPFMFYDFKNNVLLDHNINWNWSKYINVSSAFSIRPIFYQITENELAIIQPHVDTLTIYNWKTQLSKVIAINNPLFEEPPKGLFTNAETIHLDRIKYFEESFKYQGLFHHLNKIYLIFGVPESGKEAIYNIYILGIDLKSQSQKLFKLKNKYSIMFDSVIEKDKLILYLETDKNILDENEKQFTYHIFNMDDFNF